MDIFKNYESLWKSIIRPTRQTYNITDLGPSVMFTKEKKERVRRVDFDLPNKLGLVLKCSFYEFQERKESQPPCVLYLHCNSGSRLEGQLYVDGLINKGLSVCVFDFAGSGQSEGEYISLGHFELGDVEVVVNYIKSTWQIPKIAIWGRSMGAVTGLMYISQDSSIKAAVFDSPFSSFMKLAAEIGQLKTGLPKFLVKGALSLVQSTVQEKAGFDLSTLNVLPQISNCKVPCLFVVSKKDNFVKCHHSEKIRKVYTGESAITYFEGDHNEQRPLGVVKECINYFHARLIDNNLQDKTNFQQPQQKEQTHQKLQQQTYSHTQQHPKVELPSQEQTFKLNQGNFPVKVIGASCSQPGSTRAENTNISNYVSTNTVSSFRFGQGTQQEIQQPQQQMQPSEFMIGSVHHAHSRSTTPNLKLSFDRKPVIANIIHSESKIQKDNNNILGDFTPLPIKNTQIPQATQVLHTVKVPVPFQINYPTDKQGSSNKSSVASPTSEEAINQSKTMSLFGKLTPLQQQYNQQVQQQNFQKLPEPQTSDNTLAKTPLRVDLNANGRDRTRSTFSSAVEAFGSSNSKTSSSLVPQPKLSDSPDFSKNIKSSHNNELLQQCQISQPSSQSSFVRQQQSQFQEQLLSMPQGLKLQDNPIMHTNQAYPQGIQQYPSALTQPKSIGVTEKLTLQHQESTKVSAGISSHFRQKSGVVSQHEPVSSSNNITTLPNENSNRYRSTTADQVPNNSIEQQNQTQIKVDAPQTRQPSPVVQPVNRLRIQNFQQQPPSATSKQQQQQQPLPFDSARKVTEESKFQNPTPLFSTHNSQKTTQRETLPVKKDENIPANTSLSSAVQQVSKLNVISPRLDGSSIAVMAQNTSLNGQSILTQGQTKNSIDFSKTTNQFVPKDLKVSFGSSSSNNNSFSNNNSSNTYYPLQQSKQTTGVSSQSKNLAFFLGSKPHPSQSSNGKGKSLLNQTPLWLLTENNNNTHSASIHTPLSKEANSNWNLTGSSSNISNKFNGKDNQSIIAVNAFSFSENPQNSQYQSQNSSNLHQQSMQQAPLLSQRNEPKIMSSGKVMNKISPRAEFASFWQPSNNHVATETSSMHDNQTQNSSFSANNSNGRILQPQNLNILQDHNSNNNINSANIYKIPPSSHKYSNQSYSTPQTGQPQHLFQPSTTASIASSSSSSSSQSTSHQISTDQKTFFPQKQPSKFDFKNKRSQNNVPVQRINFPKDENVSPLLAMQNSNANSNSFKSQNYEFQSQNKMTASKTGAIANVPRETLAPFHWANAQKNENSCAGENKNTNMQQVNINEQLQQLQDAEAIKKNRSSTTPTFKPDFIRNLQSTRVVHVLPNNSEEGEASPSFLKAPNTAKIDATSNYGSIRQHQYSVHEINQASQSSSAFYRMPVYENL